VFNNQGIATGRESLFLVIGAEVLLYSNVWRHRQLPANSVLTHRLRILKVKVDCPGNPGSATRDRRALLCSPQW